MNILKNIALITTLLIFSLSLSANSFTKASPPPNCNAQFTDTADANNTLLIHFTDLSSGNIASWNWDFGDGATSSSQNPSHTYAQAGSYWVSLHIADSTNNCMDSISQNIIVTANPSPCLADFSYSVSPTNNMIYTFTDLSSGNITSWNWHFGDGTTSSTQNPSHTYTQAGSYWVSLHIIDSINNCLDSISQNIIVTANPNPCQADFSYSVSPSNNLNYSFTDQSQGNPYLWQWDFGDGSSANIQNPNHTYSQAGNYNVMLTITTQSCVDSISQQITVAANPNTSSILIYAFADSSYLVNGMVSLYQYNNTTGNIELYDSTFSTTNQGITYYNFPNIPTGYYYVNAKVLSSSPFYALFYDTWMPNTIYSQYKDSILVNSNNIYTSIQLAKSTVSYPAGNGGITGIINSKTTGSYQPLANVDVYLLLNDSNIITKTTTNQQGEYEFNNLAFGTYYIHPEIIGKITENKKVTIDFENPIENNASFLVDGNKIITDINSSIDLSSVISIYPNPVKNNLFIISSLDQPTDVTIEIIDIQGRIISSYNDRFYPNTENKINLIELTNGLYFIKLTSGKGQFIKKFIKSNATY